MYITYKILSEKEIQVSHYGFGPRMKSRAINDWAYRIRIDVSNSAGLSGVFTIAFQVGDVDGRVMPGWDLGYQADESIELETFCANDSTLLDVLREKAQAAADARFCTVTQ